ncbi:hypothetical protein GCM10012286_18640 [Streptomyces lasiicapitis]|uniref:Uncharacterized protein n=1 Tax=Streptomyces lasiicapitis TaxID=1923961 RepID=A0ABQ2LMZ4_9ACTN|nr:hypothetical protein GCM10012286_18640 [Streptomyces lasiicapitis]
MNGREVKDTKARRHRVASTARALAPAPPRDVETSEAGGQVLDHVVIVGCHCAYVNGKGPGLPGTGPSADRDTDPRVTAVPG